MKHTASSLSSSDISPVDRSRSDASTEPVEKSFSKVFPHAQHADLLKRGRNFDPTRYRVMFPERWSAFLRAHHRSVEEVAIFYDVTSRCAMNWWSGTHRPSGDKVAIAAMCNPAGFRKYMGDAA